jgi:hypothetical protein
VAQAPHRRPQPAQPARPRPGPRERHLDRGHHLTTTPVKGPRSPLPAPPPAPGKTETALSTPDLVTRPSQPETRGPRIHRHRSAGRPETCPIQRSPSYVVVT